MTKHIHPCIACVPEDSDCSTCRRGFTRHADRVCSACRGEGVYVRDGVLVNAIAVSLRDGVPA